MTNFKRTKQIDVSTFISFDGINYSMYHKDVSGQIDSMMYLTVDDIDKINEFVFICERQSLEKEE